MSATLTSTGKAVGIALAVGCVVGLGVEYLIMRPTPGKLDPAAPEVKQRDGSLILARAPNPDAKPKQEIPTGGKVERIVQVVVVPTSYHGRVVAGTTTTPGSGATGDPATPSNGPCPPVTVDLSLVRMPDQTRRVIASSPDGDVVGGIDVPVEAAPVPASPKWVAAGLVGYDLTQRKQVYGVMLQRSVGPFTFHTGFIGSSAFVGAGLRF